MQLYDRTHVKLKTYLQSLTGGRPPSKNSGKELRTIRRRASGLIADIKASHADDDLGESAIGDWELDIVVLTFILALMNPSKCLLLKSWRH